MMFQRALKEVYELGGDPVAFSVPSHVLREYVREIRAAVRRIPGAVWSPKRIKSRQFVGLRVFPRGQTFCLPL